MKRRMIEIEGTAEALEPIVHGGEKTGGTVTEFRREKRKVEGVFDYLPILSANSIAGHLRDQCAAWCLDQIGYEQLTDLRPYDLLFTGGALVSAKGRRGGGGVLFGAPRSYIDLDEERTLRELFPVIGLFGGSIGNRILGGRIDVDAWTPVCVELKPALPGWLHEAADRYSVADMLQELNFTRRDDKKSRDWQDYIDPDVLAEHQRVQAMHDERGDAAEAGARTQMRYGFEALAAGTLFYVHFLLRNPNDVELGVFFGGLGYFMMRPKVGGRTSRGFGRVKLDLKQYKLVGPGRVEEPMAIDAMQAAQTHLVERKEQIIAALEGAI